MNGKEEMLGAEVDLEKENKTLRVRESFLRQQIEIRDSVIDELHNVITRSGELMMSARILEGPKKSFISMNNDKELELAKSIKAAAILEMQIKAVGGQVKK